MNNEIKEVRELIKNEINLFANSMIKEFNLNNPYETSKINTLLNRIDNIVGKLEIKEVNNE
jgi:hypothetical protein